MKKITFSLTLCLLFLSSCGDNGGAPNVKGDDDNSGDVGYTEDVGYTIELILKPKSVKIFEFNWPAVNNAHHYLLREDKDGVSGFSEVSSIESDRTSYSYQVSLYNIVNAKYILTTCFDTTCGNSIDSNTVTVNDPSILTPAIGYIKASNPGRHDSFGSSLALSDDGDTLAVGAYREDSDSSGINTDAPLNNYSINSGAVYIFTRTDLVWSQQAYLKSSNEQSGDEFGKSVSISGDGNTLVVGAPDADSSSDQTSDRVENSGAAYIFTRTDTVWDQLDYIEAGNPGVYEHFGNDVTISNDGNTLAVGAYRERFNQPDVTDDVSAAGAVYVFTRAESGWNQQAHLVSSFRRAFDEFGYNIALSGDGNSLAVGAHKEKSSSVGINGDESNLGAYGSGAVFVFTRNGSVWSQDAYIKADIVRSSDLFGTSVALSDDGLTLAVGATHYGGDYYGVAYAFTRNDTGWTQQAKLTANFADFNDKYGDCIALSGDGNTLAVGAYNEDSFAKGIDGDQANNRGANIGAVYLFSRIGTIWNQKNYIKASSPGHLDYYGTSVALSNEGTLAVGATGESSSATGIDGNQADNRADVAGAVYLY